MFDSFKKKLSGWIKSSTDKVKEAVGIEPAKEKSKGKLEKNAKKAKEKGKIGKKKRIKQIEQDQEIKVPVKFNAGTIKVEPDLQALEEEVKEIKSREQEGLAEEIVEDIRKEGLEIKAPEERYEEEKEKKKGFFSKLFGKSKFKITEEYFDSIFPDLEMLLLENNVALEAVEYIKKEMKKQLIEKEIEKENLEKEIKESLKHSIDEMLVSPFDLIDKIQEHKGDRPFVILFFGINGSGKTTTIAKLAYLLQKNNISCILAAGDTFRAASIEQLQEHGKRLKIEVIKSSYNADPASVAFDAIKHAQSKGIKAVLIDTAGRMYTKHDLMREMEKISRVSKPDLKIFIAESITGNDATEQAKKFNESIGIDGIILSKADVDEKPGAVLSVSYVTKKPILFLGTGQDYKDLEVFDREKLLNQLGL